MFLLTVIFGLAFGLARGGRLSNLPNLPVRVAWLPLLGFGLQAILVMFPPEGWEAVLTHAPLIIGFSYLVLVTFLFINRELPGVKLLLIGAGLNFAVILANGGRMPVTMQSLERSGHVERIVAQDEMLVVRGSKDVVLQPEEIRLWFLSDIFGIPERYPFSASFSVGDVLIVVGAFILVSFGVGRGTQDAFKGRGKTNEWGKGEVTGAIEEVPNVFRICSPNDR
jgi:hypothetical protein